MKRGNLEIISKTEKIKGFEVVEGKTEVNVEIWERIRLDGYVQHGIRYQ